MTIIKTLFASNKDHILNNITQNVDKKISKKTCLKEMDTGWRKHSLTKKIIKILQILALLSLSNLLNSSS